MKQFSDFAAGGAHNWVTEFTQEFTRLDDNTMSRVKSVDPVIVAAGFSAAYQSQVSPSDAVKDYAVALSLNEEKQTSIKLYRKSGDPSTTVRAKLWNLGASVALSDIIPVLEDFGLRILSGQPYRLTVEQSCVWLHDFELHFENDGKSIDLSSYQAIFADAFDAVWTEKAESDPFNSLVFSCAMDWRSIALFRAYSRYMKQIKLQYVRPFIASTLAKNSEIVILIREIFDEKFALHGDSIENRAENVERLEVLVKEKLATVSSINEDAVLREYLTLIKATLRTNFYQLNNEGESPSHLAFKFDVNSIPHAPKPRPKFEIYVYSPQVEGVHLRCSSVSRGGLRWSDRIEDFRTEVLGLVKAQQVKNSVIVPNGAKGGFICKNSPVDNSREAFIENGIANYKTFISALLELTDNLVDGNVVPPKNTIRWDDDDPYFVVAADKGTATFSDIANGLAQEKGFWLGDAFASGGSVGYDHKGMGITAKGAWVSVQRHFRELGINVQQQDFSVVAVGDMQGDVFGNGMLCSEHICLVAAFNHEHIFIDPNPNSAESFVERKRLFETAGTKWSDYKPALISQGGGVFSRNAKTIAISAEMKARFSIAEDELSPIQLINALLKAKVDLFWNGGIGTYVKASSETHEDVGDASSDSVRVNGEQLGARVVGEGGNLGLTQQGRIEYCLNGGRCNTDFIDNAAGVDCSDHEVNIKILLDGLMANGKLAASDRDQLLYSMTDTVSELVLSNNYQQTQTISLAERETNIRLNEYIRFIHQLETAGKLDRALEYLPTDEEIMERKALGKGLTRPELSVLVSYAKLALKESLSDQQLSKDSYVGKIAYTALPHNLVSSYTQSIDEHQLHQDIVATQLAGDIVNRMGVTFVNRMREATGEQDVAIAKAYVTSRDLFDVQSRWADIEALDYKIDASVQQEMFLEIIRLVRRSTRWLLREQRSALDPAAELARFSESAQYIANYAGSLIKGEQKAAWIKRVAYFVNKGVDESLAEFIASARYCFTAFEIAQIADNTGVDVEVAANIYFELGETLNLNWFADQILQMSVENYWQAMARESFRDEIESHQAALAENLLMHADHEVDENTIAEWLGQYQTYIDRWETMTTELRCAIELDIAMFPVAIRELLDLNQASKIAA